METEVTKPELVALGPLEKSENFRLAYALSVIVAVLASAVSVVGLCFPGIYLGNWGNGTSLGNDLVTLVVAVPVLVLAIIHSSRGSVRARLLWLGSLYYMFYNYAFYVFGIPVTSLYLPWIALFVLSGIAFALGAGNLDIRSIAGRFSPRTPARWIAGYMFYVAAMVSFLWISRWVKFLVTGHAPDVNGSQYAYQVIAAVDLSFLVPPFIAGAYLLFRRRPWGYVLGTVALVQGALYTAVMGTICIFGWKLAPGSHLFSDWFINCIVSCAVCLVCLAGLLLNLNRPEMISRAAQDDSERALSALSRR
jgi:hypothetical protein